MATGAAHGSVPSTATNREPKGYDSQGYRQQIDRHLNRTRWQVKLIELGASSVLLLVGVLGFFLVASLVDHWVISLGYVGRALLLAVLLVGVAYYAWQKVLPLLLRSINPEYAAHAIEESTPTLKNSLLNFLLLRRSPSGVKEVVLEALEKRAATDISSVPIDAAVDRSKLIRMGYLLVGIMAVLGLYKILSPKDPFQTAARVLAPWANIARPSRVQISDIQPGSADVYLGESVVISAAVAGVREGDPVSVIFSTADGTVINQSHPMAAAAGGRFEATLPAGGTAGQMSSTGGLQQNATYRIEAGDAISPDFHLNVIAAPRIVVEKVDYAFPAYTRKAPQATDRGDLKGLEGTRISITARANQPIKTAWIEFDPQPDGGPAETMKLEVDGDRATGVLVLQLRPDRRTAWRSEYQVRFINERQQQSHQPILHGIEVLRDLPPEVEIVTPQAREIEVPENGSQPIEVRAVDPDFGLTSVKLMGRARNKELVMRALLEPVDGQPPQLMQRFDFRPGKWNLKAGEVLTYWAVAEDNRTAVPSVASVQGVAMPTADPEPNVAKTEPYTIRIVPARDGGRKGENGDSADNPMGDEGQQGENGAQQDSPMNGGQQGEQKNGDNESANDSGDSQGEKSSQGEQGGSKSQGDSQSSEGGEQSSGSESGEGQQSESQQGGGSSASGESGSSGSEDSGDASQGTESGAGSGSQGGGKQGKPSGDELGGDASGQGEPGEGGSSGASKSGNRNPNNAGQPGEPSGEPGSQGGSKGGAGSKKPEHDGEVFDRLLEEMKDEPSQEGDQASGGQPSGSGQNGTGTNAGQNADQQNSNPMTGDQPGEGQQNEGAEAQQPKAGTGASRTGNNSGRENSQQREPGEGDPASEKAGQPGGSESGKGGAQGGKQGPQGAKAGPKNQPQPDGSDGSPMDDGTEKNAEKSDGPKGSGKKPMSGDDAQGKGPNDQKAPGEGGRPQGAARTDEGDPQTDKQGSGEPKEAGAGQNGDSGAGQNSTDKTGSGQGQETNRDRKKETSDSNSAPKNGETSAPSGSKRQSDSKGGASGDRSGGGSKGAGQSGGQEGNDTAGSNSAADEGAGAANETGMGETGNKGGQGEKSDGQTGSAGDEQGEGSSSRPSESGSEKGSSPQSPQADDREQPQQGKSGDRGPQSGQGDPSAKNRVDDGSASTSGEKTEGGAGPVVGGGKQGDRPQVDYGPEGPATEADQANLEFAKKATDLVLSKLKEQEHNPDPELLDRLGMSREQMQEFIRRWEGLKNEAERDPKAARELNEALRSLGLKDPKQRKRSGGSVSDDQRNLRDSGTRIAPPSKYRDQFDAFRKGAARAAGR